MTVGDKLVHSKKVKVCLKQSSNAMIMFNLFLFKNGEGYVDTKTKLDKIIAAVNAALKA